MSRRRRVILLVAGALILAAGLALFAVLRFRETETNQSDRELCHKLDHAAQYFAWRARTNPALTPPERRESLGFWLWFRDDSVECHDPIDPESIIFNEEAPE